MQFAQNSLLIIVQSALWDSEFFCKIALGSAQIKKLNDEVSLLIVQLCDRLLNQNLICQFILFHYHVIDNKISETSLVCGNNSNKMDKFCLYFACKIVLALKSSDSL